MKAFDRRLERVTTALAYFACAVVTCIFAMIVIDVLVRASCTALFKITDGGIRCSPPSFTLAVVEYALLWFAMCSAPYLVRYRGHVTIEALVSVLPPVIRTKLAKIVYLTCFSVAMLFAYYSGELFLEAFISQEQDLRGIDIPYWILFTPMPICFFLVGLEFVRYLFTSASYYSYDLGEVRDDL